MPLTAECTTAEQVRVTAVPDGALHGPLRVSVTSGNGSGEGDPANPLSVICRSGDSPDVTVFLISGDADLGDGEVLLEDTLTLTAGNPQATSLGITVSAPEPKDVTIPL